MDWTLAGSVIFTGLAVVFSVLIILWAVVALMGKILSSFVGKKAPAAAAVPTAPAPAAPASAVSDEEIAVITAAISTAIGNQNFSIRDIKRVSR